MAAGKTVGLAGKGIRQVGKVGSAIGNKISGKEKGPQAKKDVKFANNSPQVA